MTVSAGCFPSDCGSTGDSTAFTLRVASAFVLGSDSLADKRLFRTQEGLSAHFAGPEPITTRQL